MVVRKKKERKKERKKKKEFPIQFRMLSTSIHTNERTFPLWMHVLVITTTTIRVVSSSMLLRLTMAQRFMRIIAIIFLLFINTL